MKDGVMHNADGTTKTAASGLVLASNQLAAVDPDSFPAPILGNGQILVSDSYSIGEVTTLDGILILDGDSNAVFIFQIVGVLSSSAGSQVLLTNGTQACNVFWRTIGLMNLAANTEMKCTIITTNAIKAQMPSGYESLGINDVRTASNSARFYPNPFSSSLTITLDDNDSNASELIIYNSLGVQVVKTTLSQTTTNLEMNLSSGIYFYRLHGKDGAVQSGKLMAN